MSKPRYRIDPDTGFVIDDPNGRPLGELPLGPGGKRFEDCTGEEVQEIAARWDETAKGKNRPPI